MGHLQQQMNETSSKHTAAGWSVCLQDSEVPVFELAARSCSGNTHTACTDATGKCMHVRDNQLARC
jgi:hypothetical protein